MDLKPYLRDEEALELLERMIRVNSVNPDLSPGAPGELEMARLTEQIMSDWGFPAEVIRLGGNRANVVAWSKGSGGGRTLMLNGHLDTVGAENMEIEPFVPKVEGDRVYGLGSVDMKSGVVAAIMAMKALKEAGVKLKGDIIFTGVADEEAYSVGTEDAARRYQADGAIITEPSGGAITMTHKGFAWIDVTVTGVAAHGSNPALGVDAIVNMAKFLVAMDRFQEDVLFKRPHHPLLTPPSIHASIISGGKELSTYPDHCKVTLERRTVMGETEATIKEEMDQLIMDLQKEDPRFKASYTITFLRRPMEVAADDPVLTTLQKVYRKTTGEDALLNGMNGWGDSALLQEAGIPTVIFGPSGAGAHAVVEYAELSSINRTAEIIARFAMEFCGVQEA